MSETEHYQMLRDNAARLNALMKTCRAIGLILDGPPPPPTFWQQVRSAPAETARRLRNAWAALCGADICECYD